MSDKRTGEVPKKESITSKRIQIINHRTSEIHNLVSDLNEHLVDRERAESLQHIDSIRSQLNMLKDEIVNGDII